MYFLNNKTSKLKLLLKPWAENECYVIRHKWSHSVVSDSLRPMDCSLPGSSVHWIFQARVLEWGAITFSIDSPSICYEVMGPDAMILVFWMLHFKPAYSLSSFTFIKRLFSSSLSAIGWWHLHIRGYWYFSWQSWFPLVLHPGQHFTWCIMQKS